MINYLVKRLVRVISVVEECVCLIDIVRPDNRVCVVLRCQKALKKIKLMSLSLPLRFIY